MGLKVRYLLRNLTRNPRRAGLTCAAIAIPMMILVMSVAVIDGIERFLNNSAQQLRLAVTNKASIVNPLPAAYRQRIEALDPERRHITSVCGLRWIGGRVPKDSRPLSTLGVDTDTFEATFPEYDLSAEQRERWRQDRRAILVGAATAEQFGWKVGDRITLNPSAPPYTPMEFRIVATSGEAADRITNWCHREYVEEEVRKFGAPSDKVSFIYVKCASKSDLDTYRTRIDELFARTPDETVAQDEKTFMSQFISQQFDLPRNLRIFALVVVGVAILAAANTMNMNFRDRISEYATLKSLGFEGGIVRMLVLGESLLLCGFGGVLGAATPYVLFTFTPLAKVTIPLIQTLLIRPGVCALALGISLGIGLAAAFWPARQAERLHVVEAFRALE